MKFSRLSGIVFGLCIFSLSASAQELIGIQEQIDAMKEEMIILQRKVYRDVTDSSVYASAPGKAEVKLGEYDQIIRTMSGKIDEIEYKVNQLEEKINTLNNDFDVRFKLLEGKPIPAAQGSISTSQKFDTAVANGAPKSIVGDEVTTGELKNLTPEKKSLSVDDLYKSGLEALKAGNSSQAEQDFIMILDKYADDKLAGNAQYWLGEVYYKDKNFAKAAVAFGKGYEKYKNGAKGADSLLKLGLSMAQINKKEEACAAFNAITSEFPQADTAIKEKAQSESKKLNCK